MKLPWNLTIRRNYSTGSSPTKAPRATLLDSDAHLWRWSKRTLAISPSFNFHRSQKSPHGAHDTPKRIKRPRPCDVDLTDEVEPRVTSSFVGRTPKITKVNRFLLLAEGEFGSKTCYHCSHICNHGGVEDVAKRSTLNRWQKERVSKREVAVRANMSETWHVLLQYLFLCFFFVPMNKWII